MKILITGGAGFIGHHLANRLVEHHTVVVYDNLYTGDSRRLNSNIEFVKGDVTDFHACSVKRYSIPYSIRIKWFVESCN